MTIKQTSLISLQGCQHWLVRVSQRSSSVPGAERGVGLGQQGGVQDEAWGLRVGGSLSGWCCSGPGGVALCIRRWRVVGAGSVRWCRLSCCSSSLIAVSSVLRASLSCCSSWTSPLSSCMEAFISFLTWLSWSLTPPSHWQLKSAP